MEGLSLGGLSMEGLIFGILQYYLAVPSVSPGWIV